MAGITERNQLKNDLVAMGYSLKYIDEWQPKTRLYRHKAAYNAAGAMMEDVGTFVGNVPGSPDYVSRKSKIGLFTWPPSDSCSCKWCLEGRSPSGPTQQVGQDASDAVGGQMVDKGVPAASPPRRRGGGQTGPYYQAG
jgi:hypothetical protein